MGGPAADRRLISAFLVNRYNRPPRTRWGWKSEAKNVTPPSYYGIEYAILKYLQKTYAPLRHGPTSRDSMTIKRFGKALISTTRR